MIEGARHSKRIHYNVYANQGAARAREARRRETGAREARRRETARHHQRPQHPRDLDAGTAVHPPKGGGEQDRRKGQTHRRPSWGKATASAATRSPAPDSLTVMRPSTFTASIRPNSMTSSETGLHSSQVT